MLQRGGVGKATNSVGKWITNGWDPKFDPIGIKYAEIKRNDIISEVMKPSNVPNVAGDIGASMSSTIGGKVAEKSIEESK